MPKDHHFSFGQTIVIRDVFQGRVLRASPNIVVRDSPELIVLYSPVNNIAKYPLTSEGERTKPRHRMDLAWVLTDRQWNKFSMLRMSIPGSVYSVICFWGYPDIKHDAWYINMEDPLRRTSMGFDMLDQFLDIIIKPDLSSWFWKDEDEFTEAIELGIVPKDKAAALRKEGKRVANWIQSGNSPFNGWEKWSPDPAWQVPVLPDGWDKV